MQLALAATVLLALLLIGGGWVWVNDREAKDERIAFAERTERERIAFAERLEKQNRVDSALAAAFQARAAMNWAEALAEVKRAETILEELPPNEALATRLQELRQAITDEQSDRKLLADLNDPGNAAASGTGLRDAKGTAIFNFDRSASAYRQVFANYDLVAGVTPPAAAASRIAGRPKVVREKIVSALIDWNKGGSYEVVKDPNVG